LVWFVQRGLLSPLACLMCGSLHRTSLSGPWQGTGQGEAVPAQASSMSTWRKKDVLMWFLGLVRQLRGGGQPACPEGYTPDMRPLPLTCVPACCCVRLSAGARAASDGGRAGAAAAAGRVPPRGRGPQGMDALAWA